MWSLRGVEVSEGEEEDVRRAGSKRQVMEPTGTSA